MKKAEKIEVAHCTATGLVEGAEIIDVGEIAGDLGYEPTQEELEDIFELVINAEVTVK